MFMKIPEQYITQVKAGEELVVAAVGHGVAKLCGQKVVMDIPSEGVKLGQRFFATASNTIVKKLDIKNMMPEAKATVLTVKKAKR